MTRGEARTDQAPIAAGGLFVDIRKGSIDMPCESARFREALSDIGALVSFCGICRSEQGRLSALMLEHYPQMAERQLRAIGKQALDRWPLQALGIIHRVGLINPGEDIVLVMAASAHRQPAFEAATMVMDYLKTDAPIWKKQIPATKSDESKEQTSAWVSAQDRDIETVQRWRS